MFRTKMKFFQYKDQILFLFQIFIHIIVSFLHLSSFFILLLWGILSNFRMCKPNLNRNGEPVGKKRTAFRIFRI